MVTCEAVIVNDASKDPDKQVYSYNETVTYSCVSGYEHTGGSLVRTCTAIDTLSGTVPVCTSRSMLSHKYLSCIFSLYFLKKYILNKSEVCFHIRIVHA